MLKENIEAKPNRVVAGLDPEATNVFLQAVYKAAVSGENSAKFVKQVLSKYGGAQEEEPPK
jgi:TRAF3-interacting protein 1